MNILQQDGEALYFPKFFSREESRHFFVTLAEQTSWRQEPIRLFGKSVMQPRFTALTGNLGTTYRYSGIEMKATPWTETLRTLRERVEPVSETLFNLVLMNFYRSGQDSMGWHSDDEKELGRDPIIASVSFGETRKFCFQHRTNPKLKTSIALEDGSLLIMRGPTQHYWRHAIPKAARPMGPRINLTFRGPAS